LNAVVYVTEEKSLSRVNEEIDDKSFRKRNTNLDNIINKNVINLHNERHLEDLKRKFNLKPLLDSLPKKNLNEESLREEEDRYVNDVTANMHNQNSVCNDTDRMFKTTDMDDNKFIVTSPTTKLSSGKEKQLVKELLKEAKFEQDNPHNKDKEKFKRYLVNAKWWRAWKEYVNFDAPDDISSAFLEFSMYPRPSRINNRILLKNEIVEDLSTLTSELELKDNLLEHHDYVLLSNNVFDVVKKWYGCDFEIVRAMKVDLFHPEKLQLDLYPKKRKTNMAYNKVVETKKTHMDGAKISDIIHVNLLNIGSMQHYK